MSWKLTSLLINRFVNESDRHGEIRDRETSAPGLE
jgi:hypothetical protein